MKEDSDDSDEDDSDESGEIINYACWRMSPDLNANLRYNPVSSFFI